MTTQYRCPVCGFDHLTEPARYETGGASFEICPSCGFQFGYDDDSEGETYESWRAEWVSGGMRWWSQDRSRQPAGWDPQAQLAALEGSG